MVEVNTILNRLKLLVNNTDISYSQDKTYREHINNINKVISVGYQSLSDIPMDVRITLWHLWDKCYNNQKDQSAINKIKEEIRPKMTITPASGIVF